MIRLNPWPHINQSKKTALLWVGHMSFIQGMGCWHISDFLFRHCIDSKTLEVAYCLLPVQSALHSFWGFPFLGLGEFWIIFISLPPVPLDFIYNSRTISSFLLYQESSCSFLDHGICLLLTQMTCCNSADLRRWFPLTGVLCKAILWLTWSSVST